MHDEQQRTSHDRSTRRPIGVFDSGIGGLTVLRHLMAMLPDEEFVYLGDTARVPYGNRSAETVRLYADQCVSFLLSHDVRLIVVACNTVSAVALEHLRDRCPVPIVGMIEPAAKEAAQQSTSGVIGVIGTRATINSNAYNLAIHRHRPDAHVLSTACPLFVPLVEEGWLDTPATELVVQTYVTDLVQANVDTLVLGCTHYPLLAPVLQRALPATTLIDCGACAAVEAHRLLLTQQHHIEKATSTESKERLRVFVTDTTPMFAALASTFLGMQIEDPSVVSIDHLVAPAGRGLVSTSSSMETLP